MSYLNQKTISKPVTFRGVGLHSGLEVNLYLKPELIENKVMVKNTNNWVINGQILLFNSNTCKASFGLPSVINCRP